MYEPGFMACDVAVTRCINVALERYMSRPWLIEKIQILVWHKHLHRSLIDDLTISLYGYRIRYLVESNCEGEDYDRNDNRSQADEARRNLAYHVPHLLASQLDIICLFFFLFHIKSILVSQFQLILHLVDEDTSSLLGLLEFEQIAYYHAENKQEIYSFIFPYLNSYYYLALLFSPFPSYTLH